MSAKSSSDQDHRRSFASDNYAGVHPEVLEAIVRANVGHTPSYGTDPWSERLEEVARTHFGEQAEVFTVFNGTAANVLALQSVLPRWGAVIAAHSAHINVDEGGAPERVGGIKLLTVPGEQGKLTPELVDREAWGWGDEHRAQPLAVSISQATEFGTTYSVSEVRRLAEHAHERGMLLHMDGARLSNSAAHLGVSLREITLDAGVDVLSLGGTKNGLLGAEAVVVMNPEQAPGMKYLRKLNLQLASKMRFISAQLIALYEGDLWQRSALHANAMAMRLRAGIEELVRAGAPGVALPYPTEANGVFARLSGEIASQVREQHHFYDWPFGENEVRLMCSFDTTTEDVDALVASIRVAANA